MHYLHSFLTEDAVEVEVLDVEGTADFAGAVVPHARSAHAVTAVGDIDLMAIAPGAALRHFRTFEVHSAGTEVGLDERRERAVLDEGGKHLDGKAEVGRDAGDIGLRAGGVEMEDVTALYRLSVFGGDAESHAGRDEKGVLAPLLEIEFHYRCFLRLS